MRTSRRGERDEGGLGSGIKGVYTHLEELRANLRAHKWPKKMRRHVRRAAEKARKALEGVDTKRLIRRAVFGQAWM